MYLHWYLKKKIYNELSYLFFLNKHNEKTICNKKPIKKSIHVFLVVYKKTAEKRAPLLNNVNKIKTLFG